MLSYPTGSRPIGHPFKANLRFPFFFFNSILFNNCLIKSFLLSIARLVNYISMDTVSSLCTTQSGVMARHCYPSSVSLVGFSIPSLKIPALPKPIKRRSLGITRASVAVETKVSMIKIGTRGR